MNSVSVSITRDDLTEGNVSVDFTIRNGDIEIDLVTAEQDMHRFEGDEQKELVYAKGDSLELTDAEIDWNTDKFFEAARSQDDADRADYLNDLARDRELERG